MVNDCSSGVSVFDMANLTASCRSTSSTWLHRSTSTTCRSTWRLKLAAAVRARGLVIYDLAVNPVDPPKVATTLKG